nr:hypothetical protein [Tanacetum cinerariifolium]
MRTRSQSRHNSPQQEASPVVVEPLRIELPFLEDQFQEDPPPKVSMADNRTMAELLQAPTEGYEDAIVIPEISANNFELEHVVAKVGTSSSTPVVSSEVAELKDLVRALLLDKKNQSSASTSSPTPALVKAVEPNCVTCGGTSSSTPAVSSEVAELKDLVRALLLDKNNQSSASTSSPTPALVKAVEPNYVTCGGTHSYQNCPATSVNAYRDNIQEYVSQAAVANYNQGNTGFRPQMVANQIRPPGFPPHQNNQNNFNRGNNFSQNRGGSGTLPSNTITNPKEELKGITTRSGVSYDPRFLLCPRLLNKEPR